METYIGIDLGGTRIKAAAFAADGTRLHQEVAPTRDDYQGVGIPPWALEVRGCVARLEERLAAPARAIGLSCPGLAAQDRRSIAHQPGKLAGIEGFDWSTFLGRTFVPVMNDAHAALLGEAWIGCAQGRSEVVMLTLGTGVGGAVISGGHLLRGAIGRAGHLGQVSLDPYGAPSIFGMPGSLEDAIGERTVKTRCEGRFQATHELVAAYNAGDPFAAKVWLASVRVLGVAVANYVNIFDPELIILGGGIAKAGDALFGPLGKVLDEVEWRPAGRIVPITLATLDDAAGPAGAARQAMLDAAKTK
jgi:glucokinase